MPLPTTYIAKNLGHEDADAKAIQIEHLRQNLYKITLGQQCFQVDATVLPHGALSILVDENAYDVDFEGPETQRAVRVRNHVECFSIADERQLHTHSTASAATLAAGKNSVTAPMPGKIVKIFVQVGDEVQKGQGLVVVEAMKMENELKAPKRGKVTQVHTQEGNAVEKGAKLVTVE